VLQLVAQVDARGAKVRHDLQRRAPARQLALPVLQQAGRRDDDVRPRVAVQQPQRACALAAAQDACSRLRWYLEGIPAGE